MPGLVRQIVSPNYLLRHPLSVALKQAIEEESAQRREPISVLDIGCGQQPYRSMFDSISLKHYWGVDVATGSVVDMVCVGEHLPLEDESMDCILCIQVLEHVEDPGRVVGEMHRLLRDGGVALASTHGVMVYHPTPQDYWRWTQAGLYKLFSTNGFHQIKVIPIGGSFSALAFLVARYMHLFANKVIRRNRLLAWLGSPLQDVLIGMVNLGGMALDRLFPYFSTPDGTNTLFCDFLVIARQGPIT